MNQKKEKILYKCDKCQDRGNYDPAKVCPSCGNEDSLRVAKTVDITLKIKLNKVVIVDEEDMRKIVKEVIEDGVYDKLKIIKVKNKDE